MTQRDAAPKIALITGASRGLGRNTAVNCASKGIDVILTYHSRQAEADAVVKEIEAAGRKAIAVQLDTAVVADFAAFGHTLKRALGETWGRQTFDFLVNNAGTGIQAPFETTSEAQFDQMMNIQLKGTYFLTQTMLPLLADGGRIVNLSSGLARFTLPGMSAYAVMKGGIEVLTRYLAKELGARKITVNTVAPGAIETDFGGGAVRDNATYNRMVADATALGRAGVPDDIGPMIAALLSEDNRWINGQRIEVSGGVYL